VNWHVYNAVMKHYRRSKKRRPSPEPRQRSGDYRIFAGAFPTGELSERIQAVREQCDWKTSQITAPHVSLAGTYWRSGPATPENEGELIDRLAALSGRLRSFDLHLGGIRTFGRRVLYLGVRPADELLAARRALTNIIGRDKHRRFTPHLTLAMRLKSPAFEETLSALQGSEWENGRFTAPIHELHLMQRGPDDPAWRVIHTIQLAP
jgi:2'-5' RNA ligase